MDAESLIAHYGLWAVAIGCFLEGETILVLAGFAAHRGYLDLTHVMAAAFAGSLLGDQLYFFIGRHFGPALLRRFPKREKAVAAVMEKLHRHRIPFILGFRFLYGLRTVSPFAIGMSPVSAPLFAALNAVSAAVWAVAVAGLGYLFGQSAELLLGEIVRYERVLFLGLLGIGVAVWVIFRLRRK